MRLRRWAVVGFSRDPAKYGHRIFFDLKGAGYQVYPVNRKGGRYQGEVIYSSLAHLPEPPQVVNLVVPPEETELVVRECERLGLQRVWMQPGAESREAIRFCEERGMEVIHGACAMVEKVRWVASPTPRTEKPPSGSPE